jgi:hypothetical protein
LTHSGDVEACEFGEGVLGEAGVFAGGDEPGGEGGGVEWVCADGGDHMGGLPVARSVR